MTLPHFSIALQPIVDVLDGTHAYFEALLRISNHPRFGSSHVDLIITAERENWIHEIDLFVLREVMATLAENDIQIACNLSPRTIEHSSAAILSILTQEADARARLILEITETTPVRDLQAVCIFSETVKGMGCSVAVDDYGNANGFFYADLVRKIRPALLKLDRSVIGTIHGREVFLPHALDLAARINAEVVAEFIDTPAKAEFVAACGIRFAQGALFGMALPLDEILVLSFADVESVVTKLTAA